MFQVYVARKSRRKKTSRISKLSLVDLAGRSVLCPLCSACWTRKSLRWQSWQLITLRAAARSERAANTNNRGIRLKEGAKINRSLLSLANCINALVSNQTHT